MSCVCHAFASVHCCRVGTCLGRADLLVFNCIFETFQCDTLGQVWYLIVSIHDLSYSDIFNWPNMCPSCCCCCKKNKDCLARMVAS